MCLLDNGHYARHRHRHRHRHILMSLATYMKGLYHIQQYIASSDNAACPQQIEVHLLYLWKSKCILSIETEVHLRSQEIEVGSNTRLSTSGYFEVYVCIQFVCVCVCVAMFV